MNTLRRFFGLRPKPVTPTNPYADRTKYRERPIGVDKEGFYINSPGYDPRIVGYVIVTEELTPLPPNGSA